MLYKTFQLKLFSIFSSTVKTFLKQRSVPREHPPPAVYYFSPIIHSNPRFLYDFRTMSGKYWETVGV